MTTTPTTPTTPAAAATAAGRARPAARTTTGMAARAIALTDLAPSPANVRARLGDLQTLAESIRTHGILQPLLVAPHPTKAGTFRIIAGHRRRAAAALAGETSLPCVIIDTARGATAVDERALMLVENLQRQSLSPMEAARAFAALAERHPISEVARLTGFSAATVRSRIALLDLPTDAHALIADGTLTLADAADLVKQMRQQADAARRAAAPGAVRSAGCDEAGLTLVEDHTGSSTTGVAVGRRARQCGFDLSHRLAGHVRQACTHHDLARRILGPGCAECWEAMIRADALGTLPALHPQAHRDPYDEQAVARLVDGDKPAHVTPADRVEAVRRLAADGLSDATIGRRLKIDGRSVQRLRASYAIPAGIPASRPHAS